MPTFVVQIAAPTETNDWEAVQRLVVETPTRTEAEAKVRRILPEGTTFFMCQLFDIAPPTLVPDPPVDVDHPLYGKDAYGNEW